ncbi:MAG TPA: histidine kinase dimerization/phospho-acceptor domain-containing protein, partial [Tepidisphaeraceae bacterium]
MIYRPVITRMSLALAFGIGLIVVLVGVIGGPVATLLGVAAAMALAFGFGPATHRRDMRAARLIGDTISRLTNGDWQSRVRLRGEDELGECGFRLNLLAERTAEQLDGLGRQITDLNALVDALPDAVLLADAQQRVVRINEPAARFLSISVGQATGQRLITILGDATLVDAYEAALAAPGATPLVRDLRVTRAGQRFTYQTALARTAAGGVLIVLRDVTEMAEAVRMKADFVANASHELRTPIAAIKIAFETLGDVLADDPEQTARCLSIIAGHLRRLEEMLQDLLDLSRVENTDAPPEWTEVSAAGLLATVVQTMTPLAGEKDVTLETDSEANLSFVSDRKLLHLVLKNLVENAIKYTPAGGHARLSATQQYDEIVLRISDTGVGIPPQHTERVFER